MHQMNPTAAIEFLKHTAFRMKEPVMMWGQPGSAKSSLTNALTNDSGYVMCDIRVSQYESVDFRGIPDISGDVTMWNMPATLPFKGNPLFDEHGSIICLFLDEINSGSRSVEAVTYQLIQDRRVDQHVLMDNVVIVAAGNREGDKGVTSRMALPVCNRFTHVEVVVDVEQWANDYAMPNGLDPKAVAFFRWRQDLFNTFDPSNPNLGKAFSTPRTVEKAVRYWMDPQTPDAVKQAQIAGAIGSGTMAEFYGFMDLFNKIIKIPQILADPKGCPLPHMEEPSMVYATVASVSGSMTPANIDKLAAYLDRFEEDFVVLGWMMASRRDPDLMDSDAFLTMSQKYKDVFRGV